MDRHGFLAEVGGVCRLFRLSKGYTQKDIADLAGFNERTISLFERGYNNNAIIFSTYILLGMPIEREGSIWRAYKIYLIDHLPR